MYASSNSDTFSAALKYRTRMSDINSGPIYPHPPPTN